MSDREQILAAVRRAVGHRAPPADRYAGPGGSADWARFAEVLASVGGEALGPVPRDELAAEVARLAAARADGGRVVVAGAAADALGVGPWERISDDADPRALDDVAVAILHGSLGVAENGAVALEGRNARVRALPFLCESLVLLLDAAALVPDMHVATRRMPEDATAHHHFTWISGPSKTADIELALVFGAHGPRSLTVVGTTAAAAGGTGRREPATFVS